jgi:ferredoxin
MQEKTVTSVTFHATIANSNHQFSAPAEMTLLEAARAAGITLPSSCRNGMCRTCRCLLRSGAVHYRIEWPGLSITEKEDGHVLPCVAYPLSDLVLDEPRVC